MVRESAERIDIVSFSLADASILVSAIDQVSASVPWMWGPKYIPTPEWEHALSAPECTEHLLVIAKAHDRIVGWCRLFPENPCGTGNSRSCELGIGVLPDHQKKGLGTRLIKTALDWAQSNHFMQVTLTTHVDNLPAQRLFTKSGFQIQSKDEKRLFMTCDLHH